MRKALCISVCLAALGGNVHAQSLREIEARNAAAHALEDTRRDLLSSQIEASNAQERARTDGLLRGLEQQRTGAVLAPPSMTVPPARVLDDPSRREVERVNAMSRIDQLTQEALTRSNARMRAIRPASEPKR
ncbi:hypothetical protein [Caulobacter sp. BP25]|uniref:hypothetical protein n=1 Tax=Caulobacter sp. BP25 TaxID=2048900 RepID=UPI000C12B0CD|nr:hypothetical protein [Caulobacter sp. BP25]PHY22254.1 hypothetical protein CSW59_02190 [Caulobacter sp. BP25]